MPLVPALVMLGLVAGAHGDSKSDPFGAGRWGPSSKFWTGGQDLGKAEWPDTPPDLALP